MFKIKFKVSDFKGQTDYVAGFSRDFAIVQRTSHADYIKKFKTENAAQNFINKYSGAGYGLEKNMVEVVNEKFDV